MSKELPYFRFYVSEWLNDDISLEDEITKGIFIDVCAFYWFRDCSITKAMLKKRFSNNEEQLNNLFNAGIIKEKNGNEFIEIKFLDIQFDELSELRKRRQEAGRKGGKQGLSKPKAKHKQNTSYKDKDNNKDKEKNKYADFVSMTEEEYFKLVKQHGIKNTDKLIDILNNYKGANGKKYKSDYLAILNWVVDRAKKDGKYEMNQMP